MVKSQQGSAQAPQSQSRTQAGGFSRGLFGGKANNKQGSEQVNIQVVGGSDTQRSQIWSYLGGKESGHHSFIGPAFCHIKANLEELEVKFEVWLDWGDKYHTQTYNGASYHKANIVLLLANDAAGLDNSYDALCRGIPGDCLVLYMATPDSTCCVSENFTFNSELRNQPGIEAHTVNLKFDQDPAEFLLTVYQLRQQMIEAMAAANQLQAMP